MNELSQLIILWVLWDVIKWNEREFELDFHKKRYRKWDVTYNRSSLYGQSVLFHNEKKIGTRWQYRLMTMMLGSLNHRQWSISLNLPPGWSWILWEISKEFNCSWKRLISAWDWQSINFSSFIYNIKSYV